MQIEQQIRDKIAIEFAPIHLALANESHMHNVPPNSETHFKLVLVSSRFDGVRKVARHQLVYRLLADELAGPVHALALHTYTPAEWAQQQAVPASPQCHGGSG